MVDYMTYAGALSLVSAANSTQAPLGIGATFTGAGEFNGFPDVLVTLKTDADGILYVDLSTDDGVNYDTSIPYKVAAGVGEFHIVVKGSRTCRVRFVNGAVAQTYLRLLTEYGTFRQPNSGLSSPIQQDADAATVRAITEELAISAGLFSGYSITNKFGTNSDIDTGSVTEAIWEVGGNYTGFPDSSAETISVFSSSASDTSAGTGARTVRVIGLDANYDVQVETVTLNGVTPVATVGTFRRMHTMTVMTAGSGGVNVGTITARHTTTTANVFATIIPGRNQSNCSAFTIPAGFTGFMRKLHSSIRGGNSSTVDGSIWTRSFEGAFRSRRPFTVGLAAPLRDEIYGGLRFTEKSDIILVISFASANNISVTGGYDLLLVKN